MIKSIHFAVTLCTLHSMSTLLNILKKGGKRGGGEGRGVIGG